MDKELLEKTEKEVKLYFKYKKQIRYLKFQIGNLKRRLNKIEDDIKNANFTIDYYQNGVGITERVQTSPNGNSFAEDQICKEITKLEKEHLIISKKIFRKKFEIREKENYIENMEGNLKTLDEEDRRYIELKYGDRKNILQIAKSLNIAQSTAYRKKEEVLGVIAEYKNTLMFRKKAKNEKKMRKS